MDTPQHNSDNNFSYGHDAARVQTCLLERFVNSHSQTCLNLCHIILYEKWVPKHEDCLWDIAQLALDCVSSVFCDLPLAILMRSGTLTSERDSEIVETHFARESAQQVCKRDADTVVALLSSCRCERRRVIDSCLRNVDTLRRNCAVNT